MKESANPPRMRSHEQTLKAVLLRPGLLGHEIDPNRAVANLNLGDAYSKLNNNVEARRAYHRYLELAPNSKSAPEIEKKLEAVSAQ